MKALVVYESMYGNTHEVATAIAEGLGAVGEVTMSSVSEVPTDTIASVDLLVVGGPTHIHGMSRASSRRAAVETADKDDTLEVEADATGPGLREWLKRLPNAAGGYCAAFDTRLDKAMIITGSAAKGINKQLRSCHYRPLTNPESFLVEDSEGPLLAGEADRARRWGSELADRYQQQHRSESGKEQTS